MAAEVVAIDDGRRISRGSSSRAPMVVIDGMPMPVAQDEARYVAGRTRICAWRDASQTNKQWMADAALAHEYWDGNQFDARLRQLYEERGLPLLCHNVIKRWINSVVGMQESNLTDALVRLEDSNLQALEMALGQEMKEAERATRADRACLNGLDCMIKGGIGWVEVGTSDDPFDYPDRVESMPWREITWDQAGAGLRHDLVGAAWYQRLRAFLTDDLLAFFPEQWQQDLLMLGGEDQRISWHGPERMERYQSFRDPDIWTGAGDPGRAQTVLAEFRYRVQYDGWISRGPAGVKEFDPNNPEHMAAYNEGQLDVQRSRYRKFRQAFWSGPYCLVDRWLDVPNNQCGWVPFICYLEDSTAVPYGLIRDMIGLQDEINATKAKAHWSLDSSTLVGDSNRVLDWDDAREAVNRRDGVIKLDPAFPQGRFEIDRHPGITSQQMEMYHDARQNIGYVHGLDDPFAGTPNTRDQSGVALQTLAQQSINCLGKPIGHYSEARRAVMELLLAQRLKRIGGQPHQFRYKDAKGTPKSVAVNIPIPGPDGQEQTIALSDLRHKVILDEVPATSTYRQQQFRSIVDALRSMPPQAQSIMLPLMFKLSDFPDREEYADMARQMLGMAEPKTEEEAQAQADKQALERRSVEAKIALDETEAARRSADAESKTVGLEKLLAEVQAIMADTAKTQMEIRTMVHGMTMDRAQFSAGRDDAAQMQGDKAKEHELKERQAPPAARPPPKW